MKTSPNGIRFIGNNEGLRLEAYKDSAGLLTIGYGHLVTKHDPPQYHKKITLQEAEQQLVKDLAVAENCVNHSVHIILNQNEYDSLVDFVFNIGTSAFTSSTMLRKLNVGDRPGASEEFKRWIRAGNKVVVGLILRRKREKELFLKPIDKK